MLTVGEIARRLGVPSCRVDFYLRSRNVEPEARVANIRLFDESGVLDVARALAGNKGSASARRRDKTGGTNTTE